MILVEPEKCPKSFQNKNGVVVGGGDSAEGSGVVDDNYQDDFDEDESLDVYISGFNFHFHHLVPEEEK